MDEGLSAKRPEGIRLAAPNGELRFGDDTAEGRPLVIPAGKPFRGVGLGTGGGGIEVEVDVVVVVGDGPREVSLDMLIDARAWEADTDVDWRGFEDRPSPDPDGGSVASADNWPEV